MLPDGWSDKMEKLAVNEDWLAKVAYNPTQIKMLVNDEGWMIDRLKGEEKTRL